MTRLSRRDLLRVLGTTAAAGATLGASPANRLLDTRSAVAHDAPAVVFARVGAPRTDAQAAVLASLDDTHRVLADGGIEVLLWPGDEARARAAGLDVTVLDPDVLAAQRQTPGAAVGLQPGERDDYRVWEDFEADLRALVAANPGRARLVTLPETSLLGYRIFGIEIATDVDAQDGRPVVHIDGMHHAREWPAAEMPIMWAHDLLESYGSDPRTTSIVDNARTIIIPNCNPDGFIRSRESVAAFDSSNDPLGAAQLGLAVAGAESYWRKNLRNLSGVNANVDPIGTAGARYGNADAYGIDLNRNYGHLWGDNQGSSGSQTSQSYRGSAPYSEPEARNVRWSFLRSAPITAITHHTSGQIMLYAWGRDPDRHRSRDWELMFDLGVKMQASNGYVPQQAFGLYPTSGTSRDWAHSVCSTIIYTFEHGTEFHGPYGRTVPEMYARNRGAFLDHSEWAMDPRNHATITGEVRVGGRPVAASVRLTKAARTPVTGGTVVDDPVDVPFRAGAEGRFDLRVPPSTRPFLEAAPPDLADRANPKGNPYPGGLDPILQSHAQHYTAGKEPWTLVVEVPGRQPVTRQVVVDRGQAVDVGVIDV
ncbi:MAG: M14 family zinc carboxypeptidase [Actinomycetes bacterium]